MIYCYSFQLDKTAKIWTPASPACISQGSRSLIFCSAGKPWGKAPTVCLANDFTEKDYCMQTMYWSQPEVRLSCNFTGEHDKMFLWLRFSVSGDLFASEDGKTKFKGFPTSTAHKKTNHYFFLLFSCLGFHTNKSQILFPACCL